MPVMFLGKKKNPLLPLAGGTYICEESRTKDDQSPYSLVLNFKKLKLPTQVDTVINWNGAPT